MSERYCSRSSVVIEVVFGLVVQAPYLSVDSLCAVSAASTVCTRVVRASASHVDCTPARCLPRVWRWDAAITVRLGGCFSDIASLLSAIAIPLASLPSLERLNVSSPSPSPSPSAEWNEWNDVAVRNVLGIMGNRQGFGSLAYLNALDDDQFPRFRFSNRVSIRGGGGERLPGFSCNCRHDACCAGPRVVCACNAHNHSAGGVSPYTASGRLRNVLNSPSIFECNRECGCPAWCGLRVVDRIVNRGATTTKLLIAKRPHKGWAALCVDSVERGTCVGVYGGQVVPTHEAAGINKGGGNFLLAVREAMGSGTVIRSNFDATDTGTFMRFVNHSCEPNCCVVPVRNDSFVASMAFFVMAERLDAGAELTISYGDVSGGGGGVPKSRCHCDAANCRGWLPFDPSV